MSVRNLDALFKPTSIALIGARNRPRSIRAMLRRSVSCVQAGRTDL